MGESHSQSTRYCTYSGYLQFTYPLLYVLWLLTVYLPAAVRTLVTYSFLFWISELGSIVRLNLESLNTVSIYSSPVSTFSVAFNYFYLYFIHEVNATNSDVSQSFLDGRVSIQNSGYVILRT